MSKPNYEQWDRECDEINSDKQKLYDQMKANLKNGETSEVLYRMAKICMILAKNSEKLENKKTEKSQTTEALGFAEKACKTDPKNPECHKWYCAAVGHLSGLVSNKEKIKYGHEFKEHADIALKLNPNDCMLHLMYGRWAFEVASLSWAERKIAQTIYANLPKADLDTALNAFKKADQLKPKWKENHLWMAKTLMAKKHNSEAKKWIEIGLSLPNGSVADEIAHNELITLKSKCK